MHRNILLDLLRKHKGFDENEAKMLAETIDFVEKYKDCFEREQEIGHVTGSAWIVDKSRSYVLMMHHRKLNKWFQPGGHCDGDNDVLRVAIKEAQEETGVLDIQVVSPEIYDVDVHLIPARKEIEAHYHYDIRFLLEADKNIPLLINEESNDLAWMKLSEVKSHNDSDSIMRMVYKSSDGAARAVLSFEF
jgi:8-oxo-dGTP pyrophosphatase MutT (NUDIX family)